MSAPSGSGQPSSSKAVPSLAKKPSEVTRQGTQKLKFVPTLPVRRKKEEVKSEPKDAPLPEASTSNPRGRGRGRGRGGPSDRGRGGGRPPPIEMTASGPFAMGPALAGNTGSFRRAAPKSNFAPVMPTGTKASLGAGLSATPAPSIGNNLMGKEKQDIKEEEEEYSDPDEGVEIVDLAQVRELDWMAPETLKKEKEKKKIKKEENSAVASGEVDLANAIDLSESEEEEELEDIIDDFEMKADVEEDPTLRQDRLYFFQFPSPFPTFEEPPVEQSETPSTGKKVTFAPDVKPEPPSSSTPMDKKPVDLTKEDGQPKPPARLDGIIGQLEIYRSGAVKLRLQNGILLDVNAATQPSFLQQATYLNADANELVILGEVNKQFVVSPDVDTLLTAMETSERKPKAQIEGEDTLISMDTT